MSYRYRLRDEAAVRLKNDSIPRRGRLLSFFAIDVFVRRDGDELLAALYRELQPSDRDSSLFFRISYENLLGRGCTANGPFE